MFEKLKRFLNIENSEEKTEDKPIIIDPAILVNGDEKEKKIEEQKNINNLSRANLRVYQKTGVIPKK